MGKTNPTEAERKQILGDMKENFQKLEDILVERKTKFFNSNSKPLSS